VKRQTIRIDVAPQTILEQIADENPQVIGILDALQSLPPMLSAITAMVYVSGLTHQQIGEILGVSRQVVSRKNKAALIKIRRAVRGGDR
jgi:RNA polymerase sigma factor (sigma-70 family)